MVKTQRFDYIKYDDESQVAQAALKAKFQQLEDLIYKTMKPNRGFSLALTKIEEAYMWCGKSIRDTQVERNAPPELQEERNNS